MTEPEEVLRNILNDLKSVDDDKRMQALVEIKSLKYSSQAVRLQLEQIALHDKNRYIKREAINALDLPASRNVQAKLLSMPKRDRDMILNEIDQWTTQKLIDGEQADVLKLRYDVQLTSAITPAPAAVAKPIPAAAPAAPQPTQTSPAVAPQPAPVPAGPRPTLLQTLLSETSIKIALYLGAFFVIASAIILAAVVEATRLPVLVIGTIIFGGLALAIRKRLPQPSFALFIVFSFLLPITANVLEEIFNLSAPFSAGYWAFVSLFMALIWSGSTWLYQSRLFSITAFISLAISFYRIGDIFDAEIEFYFVMLGLAALIGLAGVFLLKKWKDTAFALPLFISAQVLEAAILFISISAFAVKTFDPGTSTSLLWNLAHIFTWMFAFIFYVISDSLYPFIFFPWLAAGTLIPIPWFIGAAFDLESLGATILLLIWGVVLSGASELAHRFEATRKYNLPILLASLPTFMLAIIDGFIYETFLGLIAAMSVAFIYSLLHILRTRGWLWAIALFSFIIAYFAFFNLEFIANLNIFFGYPLLGLSLLFLLPDLLLKNDFKANLGWRLPLRIYGTFFTVWAFLFYGPANEKPLIHTAVIFGIHAVFFALYALKYRLATIGYISTTALAISVVYLFNHFKVDIWFEVLAILSTLYYFAGFAMRKSESLKPWRTMFTISSLTLGSIISLTALSTQREYSGWYIAVIGMLFIIEMYSQKQGGLELGAQLLFPAAVYLILADFKTAETVYTLIGISITWLALDTIFALTFKEKRPLEISVKVIGATTALMASLILVGENDPDKAAICFGIYTFFFALYTLFHKKAAYGYIPATYLAFTIFYALNAFKVDAWLPALTALAVLYFLAGVAIKSKENWSHMLRNSALALGTIVSIGALLTSKETGGWYALVIGLLFAAEMYLSRNGWFEIGIPVLFNIGAFLILRDLEIEEPVYHLLAYSLVWFGTDIISHIAFKDPRPLKWIVRGAGAIFTAVNYGLLFFGDDSFPAAVGFGVYTLLFLTISLLYAQPTLGYAFTATLPLFVTFFFREFNITQWIHPVIFVAVIYYAFGYLLRQTKRAPNWDTTLLVSGLGLGVIVSMAAPILGGVDAALPVAIAATLWAVEAFAKKNAWLAFPANILYLLAYFIILVELKQDEPQFFSMGAALLGLIQHYLLTRAGSKTGAFLTGMVSQLVLLGTTYIQMVSNGDAGLIYFVVLFFQSIAVLFYGRVIRSLSLTFTPIIMVVLGVVTVIYSTLKGINVVVIIGCTGVIMLVFGIIAVLMRERITKLGEKLSSWQA